MKRVMVPVDKFKNCIVLLAIIILFAVFTSYAQEIDVRSLVHDLSENEAGWSSKNFSGFYYDVDDDIGYETLTFRLSDISAARDRANLGDQPDANGNRGAVYIAEAQPIEFGFAPWGQYEEICSWEATTLPHSIATWPGTRMAPCK